MIDIKGDTALAYWDGTLDEIEVDATTGREGNCDREVVGLIRRLQREDCEWKIIAESQPSAHTDATGDAA